MSYCINPECKNPKNPLKAKTCQACGSSLLLRDRYKPLKSLGQGGFGATFLAVDLSLPGKPSCVIKQLRPSTNVPHLFQMAEEEGVAAPFRAALDKLAICSIGPTTSESLEDMGLRADMEPSLPKMGILIKEAGEQVSDIIARKRGH